MRRSVLGCSACRHSILNSLTAFTESSVRSSPQFRTQHAAKDVWRQYSYRSFSTSHPKFDLQSRDEEVGATEEFSPKQSTPIQNSPSIPWYLQVQTPTPPSSSSRLHALEDIPPIPSDAPLILHPILSHLSTQIGLDNLALLDLRSVYPPPALGSNLLMILGTARSYKHLNTSADRFCRWIRSKYKLAPYADGLLGRNELKLKLRRKARRMKLAQSVGNTVAMGAVEGSDDGITTGWVCVNVGAVDEVEVDEHDEDEESGGPRDRRHQEEVEKDEDEYKNPPDDSGVIGFGSRDLRPRIVVQMFTEEKRVEMDLEGLWDARVQRRENREEKIDQELGLRNM